jgi:hypothetical protein
MDVYLVPAGANRHELYCEISTPPPTGDAKAGSLWARLTDSFRRAVAEGEDARLGRRTEQPASGIRRAITRRLAEAVAEQRLLWHLRNEAAVRLMHPDDVSADRAIEMARAHCAADVAKHRRWCLIDALVTAVTGPLFFFVPGPNVISWYFAFRAVGHFFALRGAQQGQARVVWQSVPLSHLTELRSALNLEPQQRVRRVDEIASALGLERLPHFVAGVADRPA